MSSLLVNKKVRHEYAIEQTFSAGIVLSGAEVKSLRNKSGSLSGSFVKIIGGEAYLLNAQITPYKFADNREYEPKRTRKLLLNKKELAHLEAVQQQKGKTLVPLQLVIERNRIKLEFGVGRGLKQFEKKEKLKKRDQQREVARDLKLNLR
jgi:SsrA-binding protein